MESVIVMPVAHRPEFLALTLERLDVIPDLPPVMVFLDDVSQEKKDEAMWVFARYAPRGAGVFERESHIHAPSGCWNILQSLKNGYEMGAERVFLVEEDVAVTPEWLDWSLETLATGKYLATCGRRSKFTEIYGDYYTNPGACLTRELLENLVPHINDGYFMFLRSYLDTCFPPQWDEMSDLDDGLIRRVIRSMHGKVAYPAQPVVAHQGYWAYEERMAGYHVTGTIEERIAGLRRLLSTLPTGDRYTRDLERL